MSGADGNAGHLSEAGEVTEMLLTDRAKMAQDSYHNGRTISLTEAIELTRYGKFNYFLILISGMVLANVLLEMSSLGFILPIMQCDLNLTNRDKGVLSSVGYAGIIASSHLWGFFADTKGRRRIIWPTLVAGFVLTFFSSFANSFWLMVLLRFLNGFCVSGGSATIYAYLGEFHTDKTRSRAMMGAAFVFAMGAMMLPFMAFFVINREWILPVPFLDIEYKPWRLFMVVWSVPGLLCGLSLYFLPESPKFLLSIGKQTETIQVLQKMLHWNGGKEALDITHVLQEEDSGVIAQSTNKENANVVIVFLRSMWHQTVPLFQKKYLRVTLITCTVQFWLFEVTNGIYMWFPHIINSMGEFISQNPGEHKEICDIVYDKHNFLYKTDGTMACITKLEETTYIYSLTMETIYAFSFIILGVVINRMSKVSLLFIILIAFSACGIAAVHVPDPSIAAYLFVLLFLVGTGINVLGALTVDLYPTQLRGMAICMSLMVGRLGGVFGSTLGGALLSTNCEFTFHFSCTALILCAFLSLFLPRKSTTTEQSTNTNDNTS